MKTLKDITDLHNRVTAYHSAKETFHRVTRVCSGMLCYAGYSNTTMSKEQTTLVRRVLIETQEQMCHKLLSELERDGKLEAITNAEKRNEG